MTATDLGPHLARLRPVITTARGEGVQRCKHCGCSIAFGTWYGIVSVAERIERPVPLFADVEKWRHLDGLAPCHDCQGKAEPR